MPNPLLNMINGGIGGNNPLNMFNNNPVVNLVQIMRSGKDPTALLNQMANQNPQIKPIIDMMNNKDEEGLKNMAEKMAKERGISLEDVASQLGFSLPK